jgi:hypothetical protein
LKGFRTVLQNTREKINVFESLYEEGYYLTQIGEFELPKINTTEIYPTIQSFVDKFLNETFPYIERCSKKKIELAIKYADELKGSEFGVPYQITGMINNAKEYLINLGKVKELMITLNNSSSYYPSTVSDNEAPLELIQYYKQYICGAGVYPESSIIFKTWRRRIKVDNICIATFYSGH